MATRQHIQRLHGFSYDTHSALLAAGGRDNFWLYLCFMDYEFFAVRRTFLKKAATLLQRVADSFDNGECLNVAMSLPPRSGKSYMLSLFCSWWLGRYPDHAVMRNTCTATLYNKLSYDTRAIMMSAKYRAVFPHVQMSKDKTAVSGWNTTHAKSVSYFGAGVKGSIIGFGANLAINDDLYKGYLAALSTATNAEVKAWKQSEHDSRKERGCPEIYIGTRWTTNDIIGEALENGEVLADANIVIPAIDANGKSFCEDVHTTDEYQRIKRQIDTKFWSAEYMQAPQDIKGALLPKSDCRFEDIESKYDFKQALWRLAVSDPADRGGDYNTTTFLYVFPSFDVVVRRPLCNQDGVDANTVRAAERARKFGIEDFIIEANGGWISYVSLMKKELEGSNIQLHSFSVSIDKMVRMLTHYEFISRYFVFDSAYEDDDEYRAFMQNVFSTTREGSCPHPDALDNLASAADWIKKRYHAYIYANE